jgi:nanoRNase/pAp phosphatase (c-di-AMP/oligoRNAs hydrolase)
MKTSLISSEKDTLLSSLSAGTIGIVIGDRQNLDTVASALSLYLSLRASGKEVQIISKRDITVELSSLFGVGKIEKSFSGRTKMLTISVPYREGEIEKVSYNIETDRLNVNLFAEENGISFRESDIQYIRKGSSPEAVFVFGTASISELDGLLDGGAKVINIDNSRQNTLFGDVVLVDSVFSSTAEIVSEVIAELGLILDVDIAQNLLDGITFATRNFTSPETSAYAFEATGFLLMNGAQRRSLGQMNSQNRSFDARVGADQARLRRQQPQGARNFPAAELLSNSRAQQNQAHNVQPAINPQNKLEEIVNRMKQEERVSDPLRPSNNSMTARHQPELESIETGGNADIQKDTFDSIDDLVTDESFVESQSQTHTPSDVPDDWFLPKVFKGTKKKN